MIGHPKMSGIIKELAFLSLRNSHAIPSSEAAHAALLFAQVAWNRELGHDMPDYRELLNVFLRSNPNLWSELRSRDTEEMIEIMRKAKKQRYPMDRRVIVVSGMREQNVHVEWCKEEDYFQASELAKKSHESKYGCGCAIGKRQC